MCEKNDETRVDGDTKEACREKKVDVSTKRVEEGQEKKRRGVGRVGQSKRWSNCWEGRPGKKDCRFIK